MRAMRFLLIALLLVPAALAAEGETPVQSFRAFKQAIVDDTLSADERRKAVERYFDFDTWMTPREQTEQRLYTPQERDELRQEWMQLLQSDEFRNSYRTRDVRIEPSPPPPEGALVAVVKISMSAAAGRDHFEVRMTRHGDYWRWHSIPQVESPAADPETEPEPDPEPQPADTPEDRLKQIEAELERIRRHEEQLAERTRELEIERARLQARLAEAAADDAPYSSPLTTAATLGRAVMSADVNAVLRAHTRARREVDRDKLQARLDTQADHLALWEPKDVTLRAGSADRALVRVRVTVWEAGGAETRIITIAMRLSGDEWLVDEAP
jgi:hypothetical protein